MKKTALLMLLCVWLVACGPATSTPEVADEAEIATATVEVEAEETIVEEPTATEEPTAVPPTATEEPPATEEPTAVPPTETPPPSPTATATTAPEGIALPEDAVQLLETTERLLFEQETFAYTQILTRTRDGIHLPGTWSDCVHSAPATEDDSLYSYCLSSLIQDGEISDEMEPAFEFVTIDGRTWAGNPNGDEWNDMTESMERLSGLSGEELTLGFLRISDFFLDADYSRVDIPADTVALVGNIDVVTFGTYILSEELLAEEYEGFGELWLDQETGLPTQLLMQIDQVTEAGNVRAWVKIVYDAYGDPVEIIDPQAELDATTEVVEEPDTTEDEPIVSEGDMDSLQIIVDAEQTAAQLETSHFRQTVLTESPEFNQTVDQTCSIDIVNNEAYCNAVTSIVIGDGEPINSTVETVALDGDIWLRQDEGEWEIVTEQMAEFMGLSEEALFETQIVLSDFITSAEFVGESEVDGVAVYEVAFVMDTEAYYYNVVSEDMANVLFGLANDYSMEGVVKVGIDDGLTYELELVATFETDEGDIVATTKAVYYDFNEPVVVPDVTAE